MTTNTDNLLARNEAEEKVKNKHEENYQLELQKLLREKQVNEARVKIAQKNVINCEKTIQEHLELSLEVWINKEVLKHPYIEAFVGTVNYSSIKYY